MKKDWKAGIEVPSLARSEERVLVLVMQIARTVSWVSIVQIHTRQRKVRTLPEKQGQPELLGLQVLKPAALALRVSFEDFVARSYGV